MDSTIKREPAEDLDHGQECCRLKLTRLINGPLSISSNENFTVGWFANEIEQRGKIVKRKNIKNAARLLSLKGSVYALLSNSGDNGCSSPSSYNGGASIQLPHRDQRRF